MIADTSAWVWSRHLEAAERAVWEAALRAQQIWTCPPVLYEIGQGMRTQAELETRFTSMSALPYRQMSEGDARAALSAMQQLAGLHGGGGYHCGISLADALIAVLAERHGMGVVHYDQDFDRLGEVVMFGGYWIAPAGTLP